MQASSIPVGIPVCSSGATADDMPGITVAEEGNRRRGDMDTDEVAQCAKDIAGFFNAAQGGASAESLQRMCKAAGECAALEAMLRVADGGIWYYEARALSAEEIVDRAAALGKDGVVPFAADLDDNLLVVLPSGAVAEWDEDGEGETVSPSFSEYLEAYSKNLLSGRWEFVDECGVMEKMGGGGGEAKK